MADANFTTANSVTKDQYSAWVLLDISLENPLGSSIKTQSGLTYSKALEAAKNEMIRIGELAIGFCALAEKGEIK